MKRTVMLTLLAALLLGVHGWDEHVTLHLELPAPAEAVRELRDLADQIADLASALDRLLPSGEGTGTPEEAPAADPAGASSCPQKSTCSLLLFLSGCGILCIE